MKHVKLFEEFRNESNNNGDVFSYLTTLKDKKMDELVSEWQAKQSSDIEMTEKESWLRHLTNEIIVRLGELNNVIKVTPSKVSTSLEDKIDWVGDTLYDLAKSTDKSSNEDYKLNESDPNEELQYKIEKSKSYKDNINKIKK